VPVVVPGVPHDDIVANALRTARLLRTIPVTTYAEAVGSDITNVVRDCLAKNDIGSKGFAASIFVTYFNNDRCAAVSRYTKDLIIQFAGELDEESGTIFETHSAGEGDHHFVPGHQYVRLRPHREP
jgi:hypothetical protein